MVSVFRRGWTAALAGMLLALGLLVGVPTSAHAAADVVRNLATTYVVRDDGTISVRQQYDWSFGDSKRRGIRLQMATRERWDADRTKDVLYDISNIKVSSPTGAPTQFTTKVLTAGSVEALDVRIGNPNRYVNGRDQTYVVTYDLKGALRTFNERPELFWDVTSEEFPLVQKYSIRIEGPGGVTEARCLVGPDTCAASVTDGVATLSGTNAQPGRVLSAVAAFKPGAIANAQPTLEPRKLGSREAIAAKSHAEVRPNGTVHVTQQLTFDVPASSSEILTWDLPIRRAWDEQQDAVITISNMVVTSGGVDHPVKPGDVKLERSDEWQSFRTLVPVSGSTVDVTIRFDVAGAVSIRGNEAILVWPLAGMALDGDFDAEMTWSLPAAATSYGCIERRNQQGKECALPALTWQANGQELTLSGGGKGVSVGGYDEARIAMPASAFSGVKPVLEPSLDQQRVVDGYILMGASAASLGGLFGVGLWAGRRGRVPNQRFAGIAPGIVERSGSAPVTQATARDVIPVRFSPPDNLSVAQAGALEQGRYDSTQVAATLVQLAVDKSVMLSTNPFNAVRTGPLLSADPLATDIYRTLKLPGTQPKLDRADFKRIARVGHNRANATLSRQMALHGNQLKAARKVVGGRQTWLFFGLLGGLLAAAIALWGVVPGLSIALVMFGFVGLVIGWIAGGRKNAGRRPLTAIGTALRDQTIGFRTYLATAEAHQLNFEADSDIFRRYLPWAVLFGLTERWTKVCQELAAAGKIPPLDTSFGGRALGTREFVREMDSFTRRMERSVASSFASSHSGGSGFFSGGGSGGSSGFSRSSSGGGGGGGTSASSW